MNKPRICTIVVNKDDLEALKNVEPFVDLYEVRIDMIGDGWQEIAKQLNKPWLATNRVASEGGMWRGDEDSRVAELLKALELGPALVDIELQTQNVKQIVQTIKQRAKCIVSFHDWKGAPPLEKLEEVVQKELEAGADICKVITNAQKFEDNITILKLYTRFPEATLIASSMGPLGSITRVLSPLMGAYLTFATAHEGKESAPGQIMARTLRELYDIMAKSPGSPTLMDI